MAVIVRHRSAGVRGSVICAGDGNSWKECAAQKIQIHITWRQRLRSRGIGHFANKSKLVFPGRIRGENGSVINRKKLAARMHGLRKAEYLADGKRDGRGIGLIIVLAGQPILRSKNVIEVRVDLGGVELARR